MMHFKIFNSLGFPILFFVCSLPLTRFFNGSNLIFFIFFFYLIIQVNKDFYLLPKYFNPFLIFSIFYAFISCFNILPKSWTKIYSFSSIPQQTLYIFLIPLLVIMIRKKLNFFYSHKKNIAISFLTLAILIRIVHFFYFSNEVDIFEKYIPIRTFSNGAALYICFFLYSLYYSKNSFTKIILILLFIYLSYLSPFKQNLLFLPSFICFWYFPKLSKQIIIVNLFLFIIGYIYLFFNLDLARNLDENLPIRIIFLIDAIKGFYQSYFLGVGFGTESITNNYYEYNIYSIYNEFDNRLVFMSPHNSFATILFRTGIIGFCFFIYLLYSLYKEIYIQNDKKTISLKSSAFLCVLILIFFNPGFESFEYLFSIALFFSIILLKEEKSITK